MPGSWRDDVRDRLRPITRAVPGGHLVTEAAVYARRAVPTLRLPDRRFVIFAQGRSGSTLLTELLGSNPSIRCDDEILFHHRRFPVAYVDAWSRGRAPVYGFKVKIYQLTQDQRVDPGAFLRRLHGAGWEVVHLRRRNLVRQAVSAMIAEQRGRYHHRGDASGEERAPVTLDVADLVRRVEERARFGEEEARALGGLPHLALEYEADLLHPSAHQATADRVFERLGVPSRPVSTGLVRLSEPSLAKTVGNHEEVAAALSATRWADLVDAE